MIPLLVVAEFTACESQAMAFKLPVFSNLTTSSANCEGEKAWI